MTCASSSTGSSRDPRGAAEGRGLPSMRRRAAALGGELIIEPPAGGGTRIRLSLPVRRSPAP
jgi:signal transduction histidine kinase